MSVSVAVNGLEMGGEGNLPSRRRGDVLAGCKVSDLIGSWDAEQREGVRVGARGYQVSKEAEQVLSVQFASIEGARDINTALHIISQERGVDRLGL